MGSVETLIVKSTLSEKEEDRRDEQDDPDRRPGVLDILKWYLKPSEDFVKNMVLV